MMEWWGIIVFPDFITFTSILYDSDIFVSYDSKQLFNLTILNITVKIRR